MYNCYFYQQNIFIRSEDDSEGSIKLYLLGYGLFHSNRLLILTKRKGISDWMLSGCE